MLQSLLPRPASSARAVSRALRRLSAPLPQQRRLYAIEASDATDSRLQAIDASKVSIAKTTTPKDLVPNQDLVFGKYFTGTIS